MFTGMVQNGCTEVFRFRTDVVKNSFNMATAGVKVIMACSNAGHFGV